MSDTQEYSIKPFDANLINPREDNFNTVGGSKIVVIGKAGTGKSTLIRYLLFLKRSIIPVGMVVSEQKIVIVFTLIFFRHYLFMRI